MIGRHILSAALLVFTLIGCHGEQPLAPPKEPPQATAGVKARPDGFVGYYILDDPQFYQTPSIEQTPPGQIMHLGVEKSRWMMRNMLTAYGGKWEEQGSKATFTVSEGPTGKADGKESFIGTRTAKGVDLLLPAAPNRTLHFSYVGDKAPSEFGYDEFLGEAKNPKR